MIKIFSTQKSKEIDCHDDEYSKLLLKIKDYPQKLYCIGNEKLLNYEKIIAIVGSRDCTEYGRKYANLFASELSKKGICVISGMAVGIDSAAHSGALYEKGRTIAVLAGGLDNIYPRENIWLYNLILENGGCVISEHPNKSKTIMTDFPKRNRIISGIADGVLLIEARHRSGTIITANYAKKQGKKLYCIPSNLDSVTGVGTNEMIYDGAKFVMSTENIIEDLYESSKEQNNKIPQEYQAVYELLTKNELTNNELSVALDINISQTNAILTMMELKRIYCARSGKFI